MSSVRKCNALLVSILMLESTRQHITVFDAFFRSTYPCASSSHSYLLLRSRSSDIPSLGPRNRCLPNRTSRNLAEQLICPSSSCSPSSLPGRWRRPPNSCVDVTARYLALSLISYLHTLHPIFSSYLHICCNINETFSVADLGPKYWGCQTSVHW